MNRIEGLPTDWSKEGNWGVSPDGDVKPLSDFFDSDVLSERPQLPNEISTSRNRVLGEMRDAVAFANRARSASELGRTPAKFGTPEGALDAEKGYRNQAIELGSIACSKCIFMDECTIGSSGLNKALRENSNVSARFKDRLDTIQSLQVPCEILLSDDRLPRKYWSK